MRRIARVAGEAFDADQVTPNCEECARSEYSCECEEEPLEAGEEQPTGWLRAEHAAVDFEREE